MAGEKDDGITLPGQYRGNGYGAKQTEGMAAADRAFASLPAEEQARVMQARPAMTLVGETHEALRATYRGEVEAALKASIPAVSAQELPRVRDASPETGR